VPKSAGTPQTWTPVRIGAGQVDQPGILGNYLMEDLEVEYSGILSGPSETFRARTSECAQSTVANRVQVDHSGRRVKEVHHAAG
jgi:hypothetical protein